MWKLTKIQRDHIFIFNFLTVIKLVDLQKNCLTWLQENSLFYNKNLKYTVFLYCHTNCADQGSLLWVHKSCPKIHNSTTHSFGESCKRKKFDITYSLLFSNALIHIILNESKVRVAILINGMLYQYAKIVNSLKLLPFKAIPKAAVHLDIKHTQKALLFLNCFPFSRLWVQFLSFKVFYFYLNLVSDPNWSINLIYY